MADEMKVEAPQPHTQLTHAIGTDRAIIMGDPARVDAIAKLMDDPQPWAFNREYKSVVGTYRGQRILAMSTGIGAPSAGIGVEELHNVGVKYVIRVGSAGAMQKDIALGQLVIAEGVVRDDGLSRKYVPEIYPAVPSYRLLHLAHRYAPEAVYGIVRSHEASMSTTTPKSKLSGRRRASRPTTWSRASSWSSAGCVAWRRCPSSTMSCSTRATWRRASTASSTVQTSWRRGSATRF